MPDRLEAMSVFVATVEAGSLSGASRRLGAPLATVSRKLSELEAHLKTRLLIRSTRKLTLTESGAAYLAACGLAARLSLSETAPPGGTTVYTANRDDDTASVLLQSTPVTKENVKSTVVADGFVTTAELCEGAFAAACKEAGISG